MTNSNLTFFDNSLPLVGIQYALLHCILSFQRPISLPIFVGGHLRSILGKGLRNAFCRFPHLPTCGKDCSCDFTKIFRGFHVGGRQYSLPCFFLKLRSLIPPDARSDQLHFDLILFSAAIPKALEFCKALSCYGYIGQKENRFSLTSVLSLGHESAQIYYDGEEIVGDLCKETWNLGDIPIGSARPDSKQKIGIEFVTPARLYLQGNYATDTLTFKDIVRSILNRYRHLACMQMMHDGREKEATEIYSSHHGRHLLDYLDTQNIRVSHECLAWYQNAHFSRHQETCLSTSGLLGNIVYEGDLHLFLPILQWGEFFQLGEKTNYGMGEYRIVEVED